MSRCQDILKSYQYLDAAYWCLEEYVVPLLQPAYEALNEDIKEDEAWNDHAEMDGEDADPSSLFEPSSANIARTRTQEKYLGNSPENSHLCGGELKGISERPRKRKAPVRILCYCCGESGHFKRSCPLRTSVCPICGKIGHTESTCWQIVRECFCCGEKGHLKASCPYRYQRCEACGKDGHTRATCWRK